MAGPITAGYLAISGILVPNKHFPIDSSAHYGFEACYGSTFEAYDWELDETGVPGCMDSLFLILTYRTVPPRTLTRVRGLIVKPTGNPDEYRRVGSFELDPMERSEFEGLDFENPVKQRITIV